MVSTLAMFYAKRKVRVTRASKHIKGDSSGVYACHSRPIGLSFGANASGMRSFQSIRRVSIKESASSFVDISLVYTTRPPPLESVSLVILDCAEGLRGSEMPLTEVRMT